ncbi:MAG: ferredoxin-nitrite reductase [Herbinix sp.]|jgi:ferredoxin-nitrite reductase|nr:ferredoxin-nitrite reductase [Herbinix sp.]
MGKLQEKDLDTIINSLKEELRKEIPGFQEKGQKFLAKEITNAEFKGASGGMGVYAQRGGEEFMIRLRVLSGVVDYPTLRFVYNMVKKHSLEYIHVTTRQAIQLHHLKLDQMIDIMEQSLNHNIITRGAGGNFPRNVALSPLSGIEPGEAFDVTPYAIFVNKYFVSRINTYHLPRKFKVAFSNNGQDSANASIADLGFLAVNKDGKEYFQVYLGGSMGPNGAISVPFDELISPQDVLYHVEAMLSLFKAEGDYENKAKARIRYIVRRMGEEAFLECYKAHLSSVKQSQDLSFEINEGAKLEISDENQAGEIEGAITQKQNNLYSAIIHPQGGLLYAKDLGKILDYIENIEAVQIRLSMEEGIIIRNLTSKQAKEILELTKDIRKTTRLGCSISCIGASICQIGIQNSQALLDNVLIYFDEKGFTEDILPSISISGCTNSCARHQVSEIGFQGKKKRVGEIMEDAYALQIGGLVSGTGAKMAKESGDLLERDIPEFLYQLALNLKEQKLEYSEYLEQQGEELEQLIAKYRI